MIQSVASLTRLHYLDLRSPQHNLRCSRFLSLQVRAGTIGDLLRTYAVGGGKAVVFVETKKEADELALNPALSSQVEVREHCVLTVMTN